VRTRAPTARHFPHPSAAPLSSVSPLASQGRRASLSNVSHPQSDEPVRIPITDELDLHTFQAREVGGLLGDYLDECARRGLRSVRIIHGKGTGALRERVHAWLRRSSLVESFAQCDGTAGGWGATRVVLREGGRGPASLARLPDPK